MKHDMKNKQDEIHTLAELETGTPDIKQVFPEHILLFDTVCCDWPVACAGLLGGGDMTEF